MSGMAREKATITVDREKLNSVVRITGATSASGAIDIALTELLRAEGLRRDIEAYAAQPALPDEIALARATADWRDLADDTDWAALYGDT